MEGIMIFVLDRGFVVVGDARPHPSRAFYWHLQAGVTVRRWGTTEGLAQLQHGPAGETMLDQVCERCVPERSIIEVLIPTAEGAEKWRAVLNGSAPRKATTRR